MKVLVISDVHSNNYALEAIWEKEKTADLVVFAGDLVDYGPFPVQAIQWCREHNVLCVMGNHDERLLAYHAECAETLDEVPSNEYGWIHDNLRYVNDSDIAYIAAFPKVLSFEADGYRYLVSHYCTEDFCAPECVEHFDDFCAQNPIGNTNLPTRLIFGHAHRQYVKQLRGGRIVINPGSVSYRRGDDFEKAALYAVIEDGEIELRAVEYDRTPLLEYTLDMAKSGRMDQSEARVAFFFFGSCTEPYVDKDVSDCIPTAEEDIRKARESAKN